MKELELYFTPGIQETLTTVDLIKISQIVRILFNQYRVDMFVFENNNKNQTQIRLAGYFFDTDNFDDTSIVHTFNSVLSETFWLKIDDHGCKFVGTFLLPCEY